MRRRHTLTIALAALALAAGIAIIGHRTAAAAPNSATITVDVPRGQWVHVYPEAGADHTTIRWRCATSRRWQPARDGGWPVTCRQIVISGGVAFDIGFEAPPKPWSPR